jgi:predicted deacylase
LIVSTADEAGALPAGVSVYRGPAPGPRVAIVGAVHGNEPVGPVVIERFAREIGDRLVAGTVVTIVANLEARALDRRHTVGGVDMNRLWDKQRLARLAEADEAGLCSEERRVRELAALLLACDAVLDLHSTSRPSPVMLIFRDDWQHGAIGRRLGVPRLVTGVHEGGVLDGGVCANVGLEPGERSGRLGFTLEAGEHSDPANVERAWGVMERLLAELGLVGPVAEPLPSEEPEVFEIIDRFRQAAAGADAWRFVGFEGGEPGHGRHGPPRALASFDEIEAGELVLRRGETLVRAQTPFTMLMPAPKTDPGTDLYYVAQRRHGGLGLPLRDDDDARLAALGIERVLDQLADDAAHRGESWVSFDSRQILDLCAELATRVRRLPPGHPHRRVTVVGRGDWGGDDSERRNGKRYRQAMKGLLADGVPVDRYQLLRGAPLGWFEHLASGAVAEVMANNADSRLRVFLSTRQPHTVSLIIAGDLERALDEGDTRFVRVGVLVEAATVEPDHGRAHVRVVRAAVFSSRPELLRAARRLTAGLRAEHAALVDATTGTAPAALRALPGAADGIDLHVAGTMPVVRQALRALQLDRWRKVLSAEVPAPIRFEDEASVGRWLARTMAVTGILDEGAVRAMVVRGLTVVPPGEEDPRPEVGRRPAPMPEQVLEASGVDRDNIERWVGWKRFVRGVQIVPGRRGHDLDLEFTEPRIHRRVAHCFERALHLAEHLPTGHVMVLVAGDGLSPRRTRFSEGREVADRHAAAVCDPRLRYVRIQHAQGTHLSFLRELATQLDSRGSDAEPVALQWEAEHGATVNIVLALTRGALVADAGLWSLDGWEIQACAVVVSDAPGARDKDIGALPRRERDGHDRVGLFTRRYSDGAINAELLHFARSHCEGLLAQAGTRVEGGEAPGEALGDAVITQIAAFADHARRLDLAGLDDAGRIARVVERMGIADPEFARALALGDLADPVAFARALWFGEGR